MPQRQQKIPAVAIKQYKSATILKKYIERMVAEKIGKNRLEGDRNKH